MTLSEAILAQFKENEKKYPPMESDILLDKLNVEYEKALRDLKSFEAINEKLIAHIQLLRKEKEELIQAYAESNFDLNLSKTFLSKLIVSHLTPIEIKRSVKDFLNDLNKKP